MVYEGINALTGIIPADPSYYRDYEILNKVFVVDHKKVPAGMLTVAIALIIAVLSGAP